MTRFLDGPAEGVGLSLRRAPVFLRVVIDEGTGKVDALDLLSDAPAPSERIHVYRIVAGSRTEVFVRPGGRYELADYRHLPEVDGERFRERRAWRAWCESQGRGSDGD